MLGLQTEARLACSHQHCSHQRRRRLVLSRVALILCSYLSFRVVFFLAL